MLRSIDFFRELFFRIKLYLFGVNFYEVTKTVHEPVIYTRRHEISHGAAIELSFSRINCTDLLLKQGKLIRVRYNSYAVKAHLTETGESPLRMLEDRQFFFNGRFNHFGLEETRVLELISDIYIDFATAVQDA